MKQEKLQGILDRLNKTELRLVLLYVRLRWLRHSVGLLRPIHVLFPAVLAQIVLLVFAALSSKPFLFFSVGNITIVAIAIFPSTIHHPHAHWVK